MTMPPRARNNPTSAAIETEGRLSAMEVQIEHLVEKTDELSAKTDKLADKIDKIADMMQKSEIARERRLGEVSQLRAKVEAISSAPAVSTPDELTIMYRKVVMAVYIAGGLVFVMFVLTIIEHLFGIDLKKLLG